MKVICLTEILGNRKVRRMIIREIKKGKVFIYPTDTVYGLGCDASNSRAVRQIRKIKTTRHPFSVIAPSKEWIKENLEVNHPRFLRKLPGPWTFVFRMRKRVVSVEVSRETLGVRIPDHAFTWVIQESGVPFVTTSANMSGEVPVWSTEGVPMAMEKYVDIAVHDDIINRPVSKVMDLTGKRARTIRK
jgi:tRNA threonylcarbamoyl adenosine modification protein (Sua5/YciO/YrdC/YwlC family)